MIRTLESLSGSCRRQFCQFVGSLNLEQAPGDCEQLVGQYESEYYDDGRSYFTLWDDNEVIGAMGVITREIPARGETFISGVYVREGEVGALVRLMAEVFRYLLPHPVETLSLGRASGLGHLDEPLLELGFEEVYRTLELVHAGGTGDLAQGSCVELEELSPGNCTHYRRIHNEAFSNAPNGATLSAAGLRETMESGRLTGLCLVGGDPVGIYDMHIDGQVGWINDIAVSPDHQGRGIGSALLVALLEHLHGEGCAEVRLQVISANETATKLYTRCGFELERCISTWYRMDAGPLPVHSPGRRHR